MNICRNYVEMRLWLINQPGNSASAERRKKYYDAGVRPERFAVGDWVFYHYPRRYTSRSPKWQKAYNGRYLVTRLIEPVNCFLQKSPRSKPFVVHVDKLKKCLGENTSFLVDWESSIENDEVEVES